MGDALKGIMGSKKYVFATVVIVLLMAARKMDIELTMQELIAIFGLAGVTNISQGMADNGKERAKIEVNGTPDHKSKG